MPGFEAWIVSREDLILSKLAWAKDSGSEMQLRDVQALLAGDADRQYLEHWAEELSVLRRSRRARPSAAIGASREARELRDS